jgi:predicted component of viral defense system (DUF524 family)
LITTIARLFRVGPSSLSKPRKNPSIKELVAIREALQSCVLDCDSSATLRLRLKIDRAQTPQELWLLRNDAYQVISQRHDQTVAAERINALIVRFQGWVDAKQLVRIK